MKKNNFLTKIGTFLKKNLYYVLLFVCIAAIGTMITLTIISADEPDISMEAPKTEDKNPTPEVPKDEDPEPTPEVPDNQEPETPAPPTDDKQDENVSTEPIIFGLPVEGTVLCEYSDNELVYCTTLKQWQTHSGIDYACEEGADIMSVYGGTVSTVSNDSLNGYVVTVDHGNGLVTKYGALGTVSVEVGQSVDKGTVIGTAGNSALNEVNLGTHLHFETILDGTNVNPIQYSGDNK